MSVSFHHQAPSRILHKKKLKAFIALIFEKEKTPLQSISYIFCSDEYLLEINRQFLQHDYYTDIITFNLAGKKQPVIGDVYISIDRVKDNAKVHGQTSSKELLRVVFHGALHLCGYKDKTKPEIALMRKMEDKYLNAYFS